MMIATRENRIAERSYQIWEREGKPEGKHLRHWFMAIAELETAESVPKKAAGKAKRSSATSGRKTASPKTRKPTQGKA